MKILACLFLVLAMNLAIFAQPEKLVIWVSSPAVKAGLEVPANLFNQDFPEYTVEIIVLAGIVEKFKSAAATGAGNDLPDIACWAHDICGNLAMDAYISQTVFTDKLRDSLLPATIQGFTYNGKVYGYPYDIESATLIYNKKLISDVPKTMEEIAALAQKLNNPETNTWAFLWDMKNWYFSFAFFARGRATLEETLNNIDDANGLTTAKFLANLVSKRIVTQEVGYDLMMGLFKENKLAMMINGPWCIFELKKVGIDYGLIPLSDITLDGKPLSPFCGVHGLMIRENLTKEKKHIARLFIEDYVMTFEGQKSFYEKDPRCPSRSDVAKKLSETNPDLSIWLKTATKAIPMPNSPTTSKMWPAFASLLEQIFMLSLKEQDPKVLEEKIAESLQKAKQFWQK